jgi:hypothetical protein
MDDTDSGRTIEVMRIHGSGTFAGLVTVIERQLMEGRGVRYATEDCDVISRLCCLVDRMGGTVEINCDAQFGLEGILILPAREPSTARH